MNVINNQSLISKRQLKSHLLISAALGLVLFVSPACYATPTGGAVARGNATITTGPNTVVNQTSNKAVVTWNGFDTSSAESVTFNQPSVSSITLNKISGAATQFDGSLIANVTGSNGQQHGQVWLVNPNGFVFGAHSSINVGGFLASTASIDSDVFMNTTGNNFGDYQYEFDQAGNPTAAIDFKGLINADSGTVLNLYANSQFGIVPAQGYIFNASDNDLVGWINVAPNAGTVDLLTNQYKNDLTAFSATVPNGVQYLDLDGTSPSPVGGSTPGRVSTAAPISLGAGTYTLTYQMAGNNRNQSSDGATVSIGTTQGGTDIFSTTNTIASFQPSTTYTNTFTLTAPTKVYLGFGDINAGIGGSDYQGILLNQNITITGGRGYVVANAPAIREETGANIKAINGNIILSAGETFKVHNNKDTLVNQVDIGDPVRITGIVDGVALTNPIQIQKGSYLWAAVNVDGSDAPNGTVTLQAKVTQDAFDTYIDTNHNGTNDHVPTYGPAGQAYTSSELVNIEGNSGSVINDGADIRPSPTGTPGRSVTSNMQLAINEQIVPGPAIIPTPPTPTPTPTPATNGASQATIVVSQNITPVERPLVSLRDSTLANNFPETRPGFVSVQNAIQTGEIDLASGINPATLTPTTLAGLNPVAGGTTTASLANLSPAAGSNDTATSLADLSPSAGDSGAAGELDCANDQLNKINFFQDKVHCTNVKP